MSNEDEATRIVAAEPTVISQSNAQIKPVIGTGNRAGIGGSAVNAKPVAAAARSPLSSTWAALLGGGVTGFALFAVTVWLLGAR